MALTHVTAAAEAATASSKRGRGGGQANGRDVSIHAASAAARVATAAPATIGAHPTDIRLWVTSEGAASVGTRRNPMRRDGSRDVRVARGGSSYIPGGTHSEVDKGNPANPPHVTQVRSGHACTSPRPLSEAGKAGDASMMVYCSLGRSAQGRPTSIQAVDVKRHERCRTPDCLAVKRDNSAHQDCRGGRVIGVRRAGQRRGEGGGEAPVAKWLASAHLSGEGRQVGEGE